MSMGNVFQVPWTVLPGGSYWPEQGIAALQELGFYTVAMALKEDSVPMDDPSLKRMKSSPFCSEPRVTDWQVIRSLKQMQPC